MINITKHIYKTANQFTFLSVLMLIITVSLVVQATLTELTSQRLSQQSKQLDSDSTLLADIQAKEQDPRNLGFDRDTNENPDQRAIVSNIQYCLIFGVRMDLS